ncbi:MAG: hypothetical protein ACKOW9_05115 [Candidatus Paceibacterota bacterium]
MSFSSLLVKTILVLGALLTLTSCRYDVKVEITPDNGVVKYEFKASGELRDYLIENPKTDQRLLNSISDELGSEVTRVETDSEILYKSESIFNDNDFSFSGLSEIKYSNNAVTVKLIKPTRISDSIVSATSEMLDGNQKALAYSNAVIYSYTLCVKGDISYSSIGDYKNDCATYSTSLASFPSTLIWDIEYNDYMLLDLFIKKYFKPTLFLAVGIIFIILLRRFRR